MTAETTSEARFSKDDLTEGDLDDEGNLTDSGLKKYFNTHGDTVIISNDQKSYIIDEYEFTVSNRNLIMHTDGKELEIDSDKTQFLLISKGFIFKSDELVEELTA